MRSLGQRGVKVYGCEIGQRELGSYSKYCQYLGNFSSERELLEELLSFARNIAPRAVLLPTSDRYLIFLSRYAKELSSSFLFHRPQSGDFDALISKRAQGEFFKKHGFAHARTVFVTKDTMSQALDAKLELPIIIRPEMRADWFENSDFGAKFGVQKAILIQSYEELERTLGILIEFGPAVLSEFIPGESFALFYYVGFRDRNGEQRSSFVGNKLRTYPDKLGSETLLVSQRNPVVLALGDKIMQMLDYRGVAGIDCKWDYRDDTYKIIEINFRFGLSDGIVPACGQDLPWYSYADLCGIEFQASHDFREAVYWTWLERDIDWMRRYRKEKKVGVRSWLLGHTRPPRSFIAYERSDLLPFVWATLYFVTRVFSGLVRAVFRHKRTV